MDENYFQQANKKSTTYLCDAPKSLSSPSAKPPISHLLCGEYQRKITAEKGERRDFAE